MNDFLWRLNGCAERHAPTKKLKPKEVKLKLKPWITTDIQKMMKIRDNLFKRRKRQSDNERVIEAHKKMKNKVNREIKRSRNNHYDT